MPPSAPLITHLYTADPSAHVYNNRLYIYPSHDIPTDTPFNDNGDQYAMTDYHVFSTPSLPPSGPVTDHGIVLKQSDIPWVSKQLWAPDVACKDGRYYMYFPARDKDGVFRIGVAVSEIPEGPFRPEREPIRGSYSIDPAAFVDDSDGEVYLYFGGIWGGQLQCWVPGDDDDDDDDDNNNNNIEEEEVGLVFDGSKSGPQEPSGPGVNALCPRVAKLSPDMLSFASPVRNLVILDPDTGEPIKADDHSRRFFEASWMHKYQGKYYFSYSTGDTHFIVYAVGDSPWGPFTYRGRILEPVSGWTTHHSIAEFPSGTWWLFYHDCELSGGIDHLRSVRVREIRHDERGDIVLVD